MTWGMQATTKRQRGMTSRASVKLGERPNWMFCTRTFSKICIRRQVALEKERICFLSQVISCKNCRNQFKGKLFIQKKFV